MRYRRGKKKEITEKQKQVLRDVGFQKGHKNHFQGKKMNYKRFIKAYNLYTVQKCITQEEFAILLGISQPTLSKHLQSFFFDGIIDGKYFDTGEPIKSDWYDLKQEQYEKVREAYRKRAEIENKSVVELILRKIRSAWYYAKKSQRLEIAEGLKMAEKIAEEVLHDGEAIKNTGD